MLFSNLRKPSETVDMKNLHTPIKMAGHCDEKIKPRQIMSELQRMQQLDSL